MKKQKNKTHLFPKFKPTIQLVIALGLFTFAVIISRDSEIASWEINLFNAVYGLPAFLHPFFFAITQTGSIYMLAVLVALYMFKQHYHIVIRLLMSGTLAYMMAGVAKDLWGRGRPTEYLLDIVNLDYIVRGPGFPSGHTALATALALTVGHYLPRKYHWIVFVWIASVGLSRMYLGIHFPLDILGGFAIGWAAYALFRHVRLYDVRFRQKQQKKQAQK